MLCSYAFAPSNVKLLSRCALSHLCSLVQFTADGIQRLEALFFLWLTRQFLVSRRSCSKFPFSNRWSCAFFRARAFAIQNLVLRVRVNVLLYKCGHVHTQPSEGSLILTIQPFWTIYSLYTFEPWMLWKPKGAAKLLQHSTQASAHDEGPS